jgi:hypothetical protein
MKVLIFYQVMLSESFTVLIGNGRNGTKFSSEGEQPG